MTNWKQSVRISKKSYLEYALYTSKPKMISKIFANTCSVALCVFLLHLVNSAPTQPSVFLNFSTSCDAPDEAARLRKEENQHLFHPVTANNYGVQTFNMTNQILVPTANPPPNSELDCPKGDRNFSGQERAAMCPWVYYEDYDPYRIPQRIAMVKCKKCDACLDSNGIPMMKEQMGCYEVTYPMPVLRRDPDGDCVDGMFEYVRELQDVDIACTCQRNIRIMPYGLENNRNSILAEHDAGLTVTEAEQSVSADKTKNWNFLRVYCELSIRVVLLK